MIIAIGILFVVLSFARSRAGLGYATTLFWTGQLILFGFVAFRLLSSSTSRRAREALVLLYAGAQSFIRWAYSPDMFTYSDELQHYRSLLNVLGTQHLFSYNYSLPISPQYPGTENVAAELVQVSSLTPFLSGVLVATVSHVLLAAAIIFLFREVTASSRVVCLAALLYLLNPHASYFDTAFLYETVALPFLVLAITCAIRFGKGGLGSHYGNPLGFAACFAMVVVTHHVSAITGLQLLAALAVATAVFRRTRGMTLALAGCVAAGVVMLTGWIRFVAPMTTDYLGGPSEEILKALSKIGEFADMVPSLGPPTPLLDVFASPASVLATLALLAVGVRYAGRRTPLERCFTWLALASYMFVLAVRVLAPNGPELAGRTMTFTAMFSAVVMASVLVRMAMPGTGQRSRVLPTVSSVGAFGVTIILFLGSVTTSLPIWWERLPGSFNVDGFASGVDEPRLSRAEWAAAHLQSGSRFFSDKGTLPLLSALGDLDPIYDPQNLYYSERLTKDDAALIRSQSARYLDVDMRLSQYIPISGKYFAVDAKETDRRDPIDPAILTKFDRTQGVSRIYDSGYGRFYDLRGEGQGSPYGG